MCTAFFRAKLHPRAFLLLYMQSSHCLFFIFFSFPFWQNYLNNMQALYKFLDDNIHILKLIVYFHIQNCIQFEVVILNCLKFSKSVNGNIDYWYMYFCIQFSHCFLNNHNNIEHFLGLVREIYFVQHLFFLLWWYMYTRNFSPISGQS